MSKHAAKPGREIAVIFAKMCAAIRTEALTSKDLAAKVSTTRKKARDFINAMHPTLVYVESWEKKYHTIPVQRWRMQPLDKHIEDAPRPPLSDSTRQKRQWAKRRNEGGLTKTEMNVLARDRSVFERHAEREAYNLSVDDNGEYLSEATKKAFTMWRSLLNDQRAARRSKEKQ